MPRDRITKLLDYRNLIFMQNTIIVYYKIYEQFNIIQVEDTKKDHLIL